MNSEITILKALYEKGGEASSFVLAHRAGFGVDYTRYILAHLATRKLVTPSRKKRDWFRLMALGKKLLERSSVISHHIRIKKRPRRISAIQYTKIKAHTESLPVGSQQVILAHNLSKECEKQEFTIGRAIEKAAKTLRGFHSVISLLQDKR